VEPVILIKHGVDLDVAFSMDHIMRRAWLIVLGQSEGGNWDWDLNCWRKE
jgi:hypothetical protein